jgi:type I restriction enzyme S subunit
MRSILLAVPPIPEQLAIVDFVDRETSKTDTLIAEQQRLIELLKEKRQGIISHTVFKGLNPQVPMEPSGFDWIGSVPSHWVVTAVRHSIDRIEQGWSPECENRPAEHNEWGVLKAGCVNRGVFAEQENKALPESLEPIQQYEIRLGDVLMSRASGSPELVGSTALVASERPRLMLSDKIFRIHLNPAVDKRFFVAMFNSRVMRAQIENAISGAEGLANNLPQSALKAFFCVIPPLTEQIAISEYLEVEIVRFDSLIAEAERAVRLLQERRTALISAAVTGKIDVRGLAEVA